jgi:hypothetical protein
MGLLPTSLAAGATDHVADSNQSYLKHNQVIDVVADFQADPTGSADSATAVQAAIDAVPSDGGIVFFPKGIYDIGTVLDLTGRPPINLRGVMASANNDNVGSVLRTRTNGMTLMKVGTGTLIHQGPTIEGLHFKSKSGQTGYTFLDINTTNRWRLDRCTFDALDADTGTGLYLHHSNDLAWWQILQPLFRNLRTAIQIDDAVGGTIVGGQILCAASDSSIGINAAAGIHMKVFGLFFDAGGWHMKGVFNDATIVGCKFEKPRGAGFAVELTGTSYRNSFLGCNVVGDSATTGGGLKFGASTHDNYYQIATEGMFGASITDVGARNVGNLFTGADVRIGLQHYAGATPTGGVSGDIAVGTSKIWVNDAGTWKSVAVT